MASLSDKAGVLIAANFVKYAVGFAMPMVLVRMLTKHDYGTLQQLQLIGATAAGALVLGLPNSVYYFHRLDDDHSRTALVQQTLALLALSGLITWLALTLGARPLSEWMNNAELLRYLPLFALSVGLSIADEHFLHFMIARNRFLTAAAFDTGETIVRVLALLIPLLAGYGLQGLVLSVVALALTRALVRNALLLNSIGWKLHPRPGSLFVREQLAYSIPLFLTSLTGLLGGALDRMIISINFTPTLYAIYTVGALQIPLDTIFQIPIANVLRASMPELVRAGQLPEVVHLIREAARKLSIIMLPSFIFLLGFSEEFITLLFTANYRASVPVFQIYIWLLPMNMFVLSPIPQAFGRTKAILYIVFIGTSVQVAASFALLKWIGYLGPAIAMVVCSNLIVLAYMYLGIQLLQTTARKLIPFKEIAAALTAALIALLSTRFLVGGPGMTVAGMALAAVLYAAVFVAVALPLRVFAEQDLDLVRRWLAQLGFGRQ